MNDDMDELYRKAAENYPLNTGGADWNKVMQQLHPAGEDIPVAPAKKDHKKYLWLLLLLPFVFICNRYTGVNETLPNNNKPNKPTTAVEDKAINKESGINAAVPPLTTDEGNTKTAEPIKKNVTTAYTTMSKTGYLQKRYKQTNRESSYSGINNSKESVSKTEDVIHQQNRVNTESQNTIQNDVNNNIGITENKSPGTHTDKTNDNTIADKSNDNNSTDTTAIAKQLVGSDKEADSSKTETSFTKAKPGKENKKGFYAGVQFGPDYSTIKFQHIKNTGYSLGVVVGYQVNNRIAVETGAMWDKKNYYSVGEYFNTSKVPLSYNVEILDVTGSCYMIEIPVNVKYNFNSGKKGHWFVTAGASSYLMKKEDYTYWVNHNNSQYDIYRAYKNSSRDWFSILNISAGYEYPITKNTLLRIEPYIKLPITGVGIGSLPITSTGLTISITRPVFK